MQTKFEVNRTKIKGACQLGRIVVTHNIKSGLPLVKIIKCAHCEFASDSDKNMLEHLYSLHKHFLVGKFCEICGKNFKRSDTLKKHKLVHLGLREKCPVEDCGQMVRNLDK